MVELGNFHKTKKKTRCRVRRVEHDLVGFWTALISIQFATRSALGAEPECRAEPEKGQHRADKEPGDAGIVDHLGAVTEASVLAATLFTGRRGRRTNHAREETPSTPLCLVQTSRRGQP